MSATIIELNLAPIISSMVFKDWLNKPHLDNGWSNHWNCIGREILDGVFPAERSGGGRMEAGTVGHDFIMAKLPSGMVLKNEAGIDTWLIKGHEQKVLLRVKLEDGTIIERMSSVDTLVFNLLTKEYEIWDYKFTSFSLDSERTKPLKESHQYQSNLFAQQVKWQWRLDYNPVCRIIYIAMVDYQDVLVRVFRSNEEMKLASMRKIEYAEWGKRHFEEARPVWYNLVDGMAISSHTKTNPYRYACRYCPHAPKTERKITKKGPNAGKIYAGSKICNGKCMTLLNESCEAEYGKTFDNFDDFVKFQATLETTSE